MAIESHDGKIWIFYSAIDQPELLPGVYGRCISVNRVGFIPARAVGGDVVRGASNVVHGNGKVSGKRPAYEPLSSSRGRPSSLIGHSSSSAPNSTDTWTYKSWGLLAAGKSIRQHGGFITVRIPRPSLFTPSQG